MQLAVVVAVLVVVVVVVVDNPALKSCLAGFSFRPPAFISLGVKIVSLRLLLH